MPYTELTSYQFERGKGFTEESVLTFRILALNLIDQLLHHEGATLTVANFPLSSEEVRIVLEHRAINGHLEFESPAADTVVAEGSVRPPTSPSAVEPSPTIDPQADSDTAVSPLPPPMPATQSAPVDDEFAAAARWLALATRNGQP